LFGSALRDGFTILRRDDGNADGVIDAKGRIFAKLTVWQDADGDGRRRHLERVVDYKCKAYGSTGHVR
jgi:hypothetical protein